MMIPRLDIEKSKVHIPITIQYALSFLLLTFLCYEAHETFHHLVGAVLCSGFGNMTLTVYVPKPQCNLDFVVTLSGPVLSFAIAWWGGYLLARQKQMLFAYTLVFASFAHLRFPLPLGRSGDEWLVARTYFQQPNQYLLAGVLFLLALPPLLYAFRSIANQRRLLIFIASWLMPFLPLFLLPLIDGWLFESGPGDQPPSLMGIPFVVLAVDLAAVLLFVFAGNRILRTREMPEVNTGQAPLS